MTNDEALQRLKNFLSDGPLSFTVSIDENTGNWVAQCDQVDGMITGGKKEDDIESLLRDAIFTVAGIPREHVSAVSEHLYRQPKLRSPLISAYQKGESITSSPSFGQYSVFA